MVFVVLARFAWVVVIFWSSISFGVTGLGTLDSSRTFVNHKIKYLSHIPVTVANPDSIDVEREDLPLLNSIEFYLVRRAHSSCFDQGYLTYHSFVAVRAKGESQNGNPNDPIVQFENLKCAVRDHIQRSFTTNSKPIGGISLKRTSFDQGKIYENRNFSLELSFQASMEEPVLITPGELKIHSQEIAYKNVTIQEIEKDIYSIARQACVDRGFATFRSVTATASSDPYDPELWAPWKFASHRTFSHRMWNAFKLIGWFPGGQVLALLGGAASYRAHQDLNKDQVLYRLQNDHTVIEKILKGQDHVRVPHILLSHLVCVKAQLNPWQTQALERVTEGKIAPAPTLRGYMGRESQGDK